MLPGSAVDHLHAVVGEWQLLADLSFADYLMWVRRDDGALVCVAQCRPNTAPTVLLTDAVGTVVGADGELPLVTSAFTSGAIGRGDERQPDSARTRHRSRRGRPGPLQQPGGGRADPPDRAGRAAHVRAAGAGLPGLRGQTCCTCCPRARFPTSATWRCRGPARGSVTVSSGSTSTVSSPIASPNALSAYHRMGLTARAGGPQPGRHHPAADLRPVRGAGAGRARARLAGRRVEHADGGRRRRRRGAAAHAAAGGARRRCRGGGADPGRHRGEAPRPRAAVQGRDHPRDPPPGEEQPADRRRAAAAAGPPHQQRGGPRGADGVGAPGGVDRAGARGVVDVGGRGGQPRRGDRPDPADHERRGPRRHARSGSTGTATLGVLDADRATAWSWW